MAFTKHLMNWSFMWRGGMNIFMGLTRGMCWTLSVGHSMLPALMFSMFPCHARRNVTL
jgi:hypothetical protein